MAFDIPTVSDFKEYFSRDFKFGTIDTTVMDTDISRAINEAQLMYNINLWTTQNEVDVSFLMLTAHYLVLNIQRSGGLVDKFKGTGINNSSSFPVTQATVGQVNASFSLPTSFSSSTVWIDLLKTDYGVTYITLVAPRVVGNVAVVRGTKYDGD